MTMQNKKQKLELTWIGKENRPRLEPRILLEDPEKSYHAKQRVSDKDTRDHLAALSDEVGKKRSLLVCCAAFRGKADAFPNLTLKKIPLAVLHKCEWGHDDYSLNVANLPQAPEPVPALTESETRLEPKQARRRRVLRDSTPSLFGDNGNGGAE